MLVMVSHHWHSVDACIVKPGTPKEQDETHVEVVSVTEIKHDAPYIVGDKGGTTCPSGYHLVTDQKECEEKATVGIGKTWGSASAYCSSFKAIGCFNVGDSVHFSTCTSHKAAPLFAPVCRKATLDEKVEEDTKPIIEKKVEEETKPNENLPACSEKDHNVCKGFEPRKERYCMGGFVRRSCGEMCGHCTSRKQVGRGERGGRGRRDVDVAESGSEDCKCSDTVHLSRYSVSALHKMEGNHYHVTIERFYDPNGTPVYDVIKFTPQTGTSGGASQEHYLTTITNECDCTPVLRPGNITIYGQVQNGQLVHGVITNSDHLLGEYVLNRGLFGGLAGGLLVLLVVVVVAVVVVKRRRNTRNNKSEQKSEQNNVSDVGGVDNGVYVVKTVYG